MSPARLSWIVLSLAACSSDPAPTPDDQGPGPDDGTTYTGAACPTDKGFSSAADLPNVQARVTGDTVRITFDPRDARDYRVYEMPADGDITATGNRNAIYRCAGNYAVPPSILEDAPMPQSHAVRTRIASAVKGVARKEADATLGYVYTTPGEGRVPVYALGDPSITADNGCYFQVWPESRAKKYTADPAERDALLAARWRDDGIAFYVPAAAAANTRQVYSGITDEARLYVVDGPERTARGAGFDPAFSVLSAAEPGTEPLKRVYYQHACGVDHDELVATEARFQKAYRQGAQPVAELHWSGLGKKTTLVVEALDAPCPFEGVVSPVSRPAQTHDAVDYPAFQTVAQLAAAAPLGEVWVNGSGAAGSRPNAIARSCVAVSPGPKGEHDWSWDATPETYSTPDSPQWATLHMESPTFDIELSGQTENTWALGSLFGELWTIHADVAADVSGLLRLMPKQRATMASDSYLHVSMEVDSVTTSRRYPQVIISDQGWPLRTSLQNGYGIVVQPFGGEAERMHTEVQFCAHRLWEVNDQCPRWTLETLVDGAEEFLAPQVRMNGLQGVDRTVRYDVYASTKRVYVFTNGEPYGCVELPDGFPAGTASVTFGDALYHSGVDLGADDATYSGWYPFHYEKMRTHTVRHWSNLAFTSGGLAPTWDHNRLPCEAASRMHQ